MLYNVITQEGMIVGQPRTLEDARDLAEDVNGTVKPLETECSDCACSFEEEHEEN